MKKQNKNKSWYIHNNDGVYIGLGLLKLSFCLYEYKVFFRKWAWYCTIIKNAKGRKFLSIGFPVIGIKVYAPDVYWRAFVDSAFWRAIAYSHFVFVRDAVVKPIKFFWWHVQAIRYSEKCFYNTDTGLKIILRHKEKRCEVEYMNKEYREYCVKMYASNDEDKKYYNSWFSIYYTKHFHQTGVRIERFKLHFVGFKFRSLWGCTKGFQIIDTLSKKEVSNHVCLTDPMNGCPGDFAESFSRESDILSGVLEDMNLPPTFLSTASELCRKRAWENYHKNPAPWDVDMSNEDYEEAE